MTGIGKYGGYLKGPAVYILGLSAALILANLIVSAAVIRAQEAELSIKEGKAVMLRDYLGGKREGILVEEPFLIEEARAGVEGFRKGLPGSESLTKVLGEVLKLARKNGLKVVSADYSPETVKDSGFSRYTVSFPVEGRYAQIKRFIYDIEGMREAVVIEDISLASGRAGTRTIGLKIRITVYYV